MTRVLVWLRAHLDPPVIGLLLLGAGVAATYSLGVAAIVCGVVLILDGVIDALIMARLPTAARRRST